MFTKHHMTNIPSLMRMIISTLISLNLLFSSTVFPVILAISDTKSDDHECSQKTCRPGGPVVRFPFMLREKQPQYCGFDSRFSVYCDDMNRTILELPTAKVEVMAFDYSAQSFDVQSLEDCFAKQSRDIDVSRTPFAFELKGNNYSVFSCSALNKEPGNLVSFTKLSCLEYDNGYEVYGLPSDASIGYQIYSMESCTKMFNTYKWDSGETLGSKFMSLSWSLSECRKCEKIGGRCGWKAENNREIGCFGGNEAHSGKWIIIRISGSMIGLLSLTLLISGVYHVYSKYKHDRENQKRLKKFLEDYTAMRPTRYSYADIKKITNDFKEALGKGGQGNVFRGKVSNEVFVAVKMLHDYTGNGDDFINEVGTMGATHHVNVVRLLGFCADGAKRALVYEFVPNGSLDKFIFNDSKEQQTLGMKSLEEIAVGIARGVEYLHQGCEQRILHFDIKPHNILLDKDYNPKISDFGLAKLCEKGRSAVSMTAARGTMGYIAPEVFSRHFGSVTNKSDIYSFGMLLLEMVGRRKNVDGNAKNVSRVNFPEWVYGCLVNGEDLRIQVEDDEELQIAKKLAVAGLWCIQWNPVDRPSITLVIQMLEANAKDLSLPPNPFSNDNSDNISRLSEISETE